MLNLLFDNNKVIIDDYEILSNKINYTYLTIDYLEKKYKNSCLTMIIGKDQISNLSNWNNFNIFIKKINIICFNRTIENKALSQDSNLNKINYIDDFNINVSSTNIRNNIKSYNNKYLTNSLSYEVLEYIEDNNLYVWDNFI